MKKKEAEKTGARSGKKAQQKRRTPRNIRNQGARRNKRAETKTMTEKRTDLVENGGKTEEEEQVTAARKKKKRERHHANKIP